MLFVPFRQTTDIFSKRSWTPFCCFEKWTLLGIMLSWYNRGESMLNGTGYDYTLERIIHKLPEIACIYVQLCIISIFMKYTQPHLNRQSTAVTYLHILASAPVVHGMCCRISSEVCLCWQCGILFTHDWMDKNILPNAVTAFNDLGFASFNWSSKIYTCFNQTRSSTSECCRHTMMFPGLGLCIQSS